MEEIEPPPQTILVVEDECLVRMTAVEMFEDAGFRVIEAETGEEGMSALGGDIAIAGLFTDVDLSGPIDGLSLAATARAGDPDLSILVVSGRRSPTATDMPCDALFLDKPYDLGRVLRTMNNLLADEDSKA
jgi:DNA-binding NtrC family response regulator